MSTTKVIRNDLPLEKAKINGVTMFKSKKFLYLTFAYQFFWSKVPTCLKQKMYFYSIT